jgi:hypothetical protein
VIQVKLVKKATKNNNWLFRIIIPGYIDRFQEAPKNITSRKKAKERALKEFLKQKPIMERYL